MSTQEKLEDALRACENNFIFALEQLERACHEATEVGVAKWRELYDSGMAHLVRFYFTFTRMLALCKRLLSHPAMFHAHTDSHPCAHLL